MNTTSSPAVWAGYEAPKGMKLAWKVVHPDGRTRNDFQWPFKGRVKADPGDSDFSPGGPCPVFMGDGLCLALTWWGAASGGISAITGLAVSYYPKHVLGSNQNKLRVSSCLVLGPLDLHRLLRGGRGKKAYLYGANLYGANLYGADLHGADLHGADLHEADLHEADLHEADLLGADLREANLRGADLRGADLYGADLREANLHGADLYRADLRGAYRNHLT